MKKTLSLVAVLFISVLLHAQATYEVGKIYEINGVKGLVYKVSANGRHGMMMSLQPAMKKKQSVYVSDKNLYADAAELCKDAENGMNNYKAVEAYITEHNLSWSVFPIYEWVHNLGEGWYIPSKAELMEMISCLYDGQEFTNNTLTGRDKTLKKWQQELKNNKATQFFYPLVSSTGHVYTNKKGKSFYFRYGVNEVKQSSNNNNIFAAISDMTIDKIQLFSFYYKAKYPGTRAIRVF